jgi:hypothetical protein
MDQYSTNGSTGDPSSTADSAGQSIHEILDIATQYGAMVISDRQAYDAPFKTDATFSLAQLHPDPVPDALK